MRKGGRLLIVFGVILALAAAVLAIFALRDTDETGVADEPDVLMINVVQATRDIAANQVITEDDIEVVEAEEGTVAANTARSAGQVIGLAASGDIVSGQRILMANLNNPGLSHMIDSGMRAVAIPIDRTNALGGMIRADDRIDIVYSIAFDMVDLQEQLAAYFGEDFADQFRQDIPEGEEAPPLPELSSIFPFLGEPGSMVQIRTSDELDPATKLILQNIRVVRVVAGDMTVDTDAQATRETREASDDDEAENDTTTAEDFDRLPSVDLLIIEVDPAAAELIKFILDYEGQYQIALRSPDDGETVETSGMTFRQMVEDFGLPIPLPAEVPDPGEEE
jgi:pilus assembly protein CpaB